MKSLYLRYRGLLFEVIRYLIVGGLATLVDWGILVLFQELVFSTDVYYLNMNITLFTSTTLGFIGGLLFNYVLSIYFVFLHVKNKENAKTLKSFILFALIGVVGLLFTLIGMHIFTEWLQIHYMIAKAVMTILVLAWNYIARKILIFKS